MKFEVGCSPFVLFLGLNFAKWILILTMLPTLQSNTVSLIEYAPEKTRTSVGKGFSSGAFCMFVGDVVIIVLMAGTMRIAAEGNAEKIRLLQDEIRRLHRTINSATKSTTRED
jgi:hypothetical protein